MSDWQEFTGKTVQDALTSALIALGVPEDQVEYEEVQKEGSGFLGLFGAKEAIIRARIKDSETDRTFGDVENNVKSSAASAVNTGSSVAVFGDPEKDAKEFLTDVFDKMNLQVEIQTAYSEETVFIELVGEDMGVLIGKRGQTLDSLQYLTSLVVNKGREEYIRIKMDSENYRDRRQKTIENLAKNLAKKAKNTGRVVHVDAMNPYERRIIHSVLQEDKYVDTHSEGEEPNRHVVITLTEEYANMPRKPRGKYNNRRGGYNRGYKKDGYRKNGRYGKRSDSYQNDYKDNNSNHEKGESSEEATE